jgi:SAM-dependent methyltransferase
VERTEYAAFYDAEAGHWWFRSRLAIVLDLVRAAPLRGPILDVGCGPGPCLEALAGEHAMIGLDDSPEALRICRARGLRRLVRAAAPHLPFRDGALGGLLALDVLEHIPDDAAALREFARVLRPGGGAILTVPAHGFLFGPHDVAVHHVRRYARSAFARRITAAFGRPPAREGYFFALPFCLTTAWRILERVFGALRPKRSNVHLRLPRPLNAALERLMRLERRLLRRRTLPFGSSLLAVLRR